MSDYNPFKTVSMSDLPEGAWTYITGQPQDEKDIQTYYKAIPWLFRGVDIRADAVASMPFSIYRGETEIDNSEDYQNVVKFLPNPGGLFGLLEAALVIWNYAYAFKLRNEFMTKGLRYLLPSSIRPKIDTDGAISFTRRVGNKDTAYTVDDIIYFWGRDPFVEIGPPQASPAQAAAAAAGVLWNTDQFAAAFFARGAIKATLLTTTNILPAERERLKSWWQRMFQRGVKGSWQTDIVNADTVKPVVVGEGLESLENTNLTESKRIDIAAALGIPYSVLFSNASNRATAEQDDMHLYTKTVIPECEFIAEVLNDQVFKPLGYKFMFNPQALDLFQASENERAASLEKLIAALEKPEEFLLAADILGYDLDPEVHKRIEAMIAEKAKRAAEIQANMDNAKPQADNMYIERGYEESEDELVVPDRRLLKQPPPNRRSIDLGKWEGKSLKLVKRGKPAACAFESDHIDPVTIAAVGAQLEDAQTEADVKAIFSSLWLGYP